MSQREMYPKRNGVADLLRTRPSPSCVIHAEFGRSALKGACINTGEPQKVWSVESPLSCDWRCV